MAYKQSPASFMKHKSKAVGYMAVGSSFHLDTDPKEKDKEKLTKAQKLTMEGAALDKDVSFEVKTIDDPRSSRSIVEIKKQLKKEKPKKYQEIYGE